MEAKAVAKGVRVSPFKVRQTLTLIRGKDVGEAMTALRYTPKKTARIVEKVLRSAVANAEYNPGLDVDRLVVKKAFADQGGSMRRWRAVSMGRAHPYRHRTSHITIVVSER